MKFLVIFALTLATVSAFDLRNAEIKQRSAVVPIEKAEGRITNGQNAAVGQFPYQVGITLQFSDFSTSWCGGSLIGQNWVLTAAHCTQDVQSVIVYLGATVRTSAEITYSISKTNILIHAGYNSNTLLNDISLIKIPSVNYSAKVQPVRLPAISGSHSAYVGEKAIASGWGYTQDNGSITNYLQWARLEVISNAECAGNFGPAIASSNICTSTYGGVSICQGDSGGPLVLESSKIQVGVSSFVSAAGCALGYPAAFTRLTSYLQWIAANTGISY